MTFSTGSVFMGGLYVHCTSKFNYINCVMSAFLKNITKFISCLSLKINLASNIWNLINYFPIGIIPNFITFNFVVNVKVPSVSSTVEIIAIIALLMSEC